MLALDWNLRRLRILQGKVNRGELSLSKAASLDIPESVDRGDAKAMGAWIKDQLKPLGFSDSKGVTSIDRRHLVLKTASLVGVSEEEIADVVRLQAMRDLTLPIDEAIVDFVRVEPLGAGEESHALIAVAKRDIVSFHRQVLEAAGVTPIGVWPGPTAQVLAANVRAASLMKADEVGCALLIVVDGDAVELTVMREDHCLLTLSKASKSDGAGGSAIAQAIRRLQASFSAQYPGLKIRLALVAGELEGGESEAAEIKAVLGCELESFDPLAGIVVEGAHQADPRGPFVDAVGALILSRRPKRQRIDFMSPKKSVPRPNRARALALALSAAALLALLQTHRYYKSKSEGFARELARAKDRQKTLDKELKSLAPIEERWRAIEQWRGEDVVWLDLYKRLMSDFPDSKQVFLTQMNLAQARRPGFAANVHVEGFANNPKTVTEMIQRLAKQGGYDVRPGSMQPAAKSDGYPWRFSADIAVPQTPRAPRENGLTRAGSLVTGAGR